MYVRPVYIASVECGRICMVPISATAYNDFKESMPNMGMPNLN